MIFSKPLLLMAALFVSAVHTTAANAPSFSTGHGLRELQSNNNDHHDDSSGDYGVCGCSECTSDVLNRLAGEYTCMERIAYLMEGPHQLNEKEACIRVARNEFQDICGHECDPGRCDGKKLPAEELPSTYCGCKSCTHDVWQKKTSDGHTCGARISFLADFNGFEMQHACRVVGGQEFPDECGACNPDTCEPVHGPDTEYRCGCSRCSDAVWNLDAEGATCGARVNYLMQEHSDLYPTELDACKQVAQVEYPNICGSNCAPDHCDVPLQARTPLYCFPPFDDRTRFKNMWGNHTVEVKESKDEVGGVCGPQNNKFTTNTVEKLNNREMKLTFQYNGDAWEGSEIRVRRPNEDMPFRYGSYAFSIKSVRVIDSQTGEIESTILPQSIILSMHTWDATENYGIHENFNHQVGIDVSRYDKENGKDAQFMVAPAIEFNTRQFFTGQGETYDQSNRKYSFDWRPAKIEFDADAGDDGKAWTYSTGRALRQGQPDFTQCLPADAEVRINLWNLYGSLPPTGMAHTPHHVVEVVVNDFTYTPSGLEHVGDGGTCSKDCHCKASSQCLGNVCTPVEEQYSIESWYANSPSGASDSSKTSSSKTTRPVETVLGFAVFGGAVAALALIAYQRAQQRRETVVEAIPVADFVFPVSAVKS